MRKFDSVKASAEIFEHTLKSHKANFDLPWYPYGTLNNFIHLDPLIAGNVDDLFSGNKRIADVGAADGDFAFYMESLGNEVDIYDYGPTNYNSLRGARHLKEVMKSNIGIYEIDLDGRFTINRKYDVVFFMGLLYHLKNPFFALEYFSKLSEYMFLSTRVARFFRPSGEDVSSTAVAYLLAPDESNNDATNFWIFSEAGLNRLFSRTGWSIVSAHTVGDTMHSNPRDSNHDERIFCVLKSQNS